MFTLVHILASQVDLQAQWHHVYHLYPTDNKQNHIRNYYTKQKRFFKTVPVFLEVHDLLSLQVALDDPVIRATITKRADNYALELN